MLTDNRELVDICPQRTGHAADRPARPWYTDHPGRQRQSGGEFTYGVTPVAYIRCCLTLTLAHPSG